MGKKRGCPSVGFPPVIVPDNWLHHSRGLALVPTFHLTTHCSTAGQEEHWQSWQEEKPGGSDPGSPAMQSNSDSASLWLVSFGHKSIPSSIIQPHPGGRWRKWGRYIKWAHVLTGARVERPGQESWSGQALRRCPRRELRTLQAWSNRSNPPHTTQWFLAQYAPNIPHSTPLTRGV